MRQLTMRHRAAVLGVVGLLVWGPALALAQAEKDGQQRTYRGRLGPGADRIKKEDGKVYVWSGRGAPGTAAAEYFDFSGAPFPAEDLQFGIGKDRIRSIDDPYFVKPDDPRLLEQLPVSPYRKDERPKSNDEIMVIGYADGDDVRAYPVGLLDRHELVNDKVGGKPVTVGW